jgi:hypothetical protein
MRAFTLNNTAVNLAAPGQRIPFLSNYTVVLLNTDDASRTVQQSVNGTDWTTLATVGANAAVEAVVNQQYLRVSTAHNIVVMGN